MKQLLVICLILVSAFSSVGQGPRIVYTEPEREDSRRTEFDIIGKVGGNYLVYKNNRNDHAISVYDEEMKLKDRVKLDYIKDRWINMDFVAYQNHFYMIYQYQQRNTLYCVGVKLDANAQKMGEPFELDTTHIGFAANNKIYSTVNSDDKQRIMIFKVNSRNQKNFFFTTLLFDQNLSLLNKSRMSMVMEERNDYFTDFLLSNDGDLVFGKFRRNNSNSDFISKIFMVIKHPDEPEFSINEIDTEKKILDELKIKVDNSNKRILVNSLYYKQRRGNIEGMYTMVIDQKKNVKIADTVTIFNEDLRAAAKGSDANTRMAFNEYYIKNVITRRDGGFMIITESMYNTPRVGAFNRGNYFNYGNPWLSPLDYYYWSPAYSSIYNPWNRFGGSSTRYYAENIMVLSYNANGGLEWSNVIPKSQFDDESDNMLSYQIVNTGGELHFLFNQFEKRTLLLNDQTMAPNGKITRNPTLKNLDKGYEFMPRLGKQVSARQMIIPCLYRSYLCFAKIDF
jgi:hypothetical protein